MRYQHVAALVFDQPVMIEPFKGRTIAQYLARRMLGAIALPAMRVGELQPARRETLQVENGIAIIDVTGVLVNRAGQMDADSTPLLSYERLTSEIDAAAADSSIRGILLRIDSPGGESLGVFDLAARIRQVDKPVWAIAAPQAASAAYLIGSAARRFFVSQDAMTGSIGVVLNRADITKALEAEGIQVIQIAAGARKLDGSHFQPWKPSSAEEKALVAYVTDYYDLFVKAVAGYRGVSEESVRATDAGVFVGQTGVQAGLADEVSTIRGTLQRFTETLNTQPRSPTMSAANDSPTPAPTPAPAPVPAAPPAAIDPVQLRREGAEAERQRLSRIDAVTLPGYEQLAAKAKADGVTPEAFTFQQAEEQKKRSKAKLTGLREDEARLDKPEPGVTGDAGEASDEAKEVLAIVGLHRAMQGQPALGRAN